MKLEIDLDVHGKHLRDLDNVREQQRIAANRVKNLEGELYNAKSSLQDLNARVTQAQGMVANAILKEALPKLNEPEPAIEAKPEATSNA